MYKKLLFTVLCFLGSCIIKSNTIQETNDKKASQIRTISLQEYIQAHIAVMPPWQKTILSGTTTMTSAFLTYTLTDLLSRYIRRSFKIKPFIYSYGYEDKPPLLGLSPGQQSKKDTGWDIVIGLLYACGALAMRCYTIWEVNCVIQTQFLRTMSPQLSGLEKVSHTALGILAINSDHIIRLLLK